MSANKRLEKFLNGVERRAEKATDMTELESVLEELIGYKKRYKTLKYDNGNKWIAALVSAALLIIVYLLDAGHLGDFPSVNGFIEENSIVVYGLLIIAFAVPAFLLVAARMDIYEASNAIFNKAILLRNGLYEKGFDGVSLYRQWRSRFADFERGDIKHCIEELTYLKMTEEFDRPAKVYTFKYVEEEYYTERDSKGNTRTRKREITKYRYGFMSELKPVRSIGVYSKWNPQARHGHSWQTTSAEFNKEFNVRAESEMAAVKFLQPVIVLAFLELEKSFPSLSLELDSSSALCISFDRSDVLNMPRKHNVTEPELFAEEVKSVGKLPLLEKLKEFVLTLDKYCDNNFED